jgi:hypothetical protein
MAVHNPDKANGCEKRRGCSGHEAYGEQVAQLVVHSVDKAESSQLKAFWMVSAALP